MPDVTFPDKREVRRAFEALTGGETHYIFNNIAWLRETYEQEVTINAADAVKRGERVLLVGQTQPGRIDGTR